MAAGNAKEIMGGARLLLHPADMGGIEPGRLSACDDGDMDLDPGRAKPGDRAAAAQYLVVGMGRYDQRPPHILKGAHRADPSMLWSRGGCPEAIVKSDISSAPPSPQRTTQTPSLRPNPCTGIEARARGEDVLSGGER